MRLQRVEVRGCFSPSGTYHRVSIKEEEGSIIVASREEGVRPPDEAKQWLAMVFVDLLGKVVKVINGGDHSERE